MPVVSTNGNGFPVAEKLPEHHRRFYIPLKLKLVLVALCSLAWVGFSLWLAIPWINELGQWITVPIAAAVIAGIAIIPGYLNAHLISSLLIDRAPPLRFDVDFPAVTLIVACFNEEDVIEETLDYAATQDYPGELRILVADNGSTDKTLELAALCCSRLDERTRPLLPARRQGQHPELLPSREGRHAAHRHGRRRRAPSPEALQGAASPARGLAPGRRSRSPAPSSSATPARTF